FRLAVNRVETKSVLLRQGGKDHPTLSHRRRQLRRIAEKQKKAEEFLKIGEHLRIEHRCLIHETDVEWCFPPFPSLDEVRAAQPGTRQGTGKRLVHRKGSGRPVERRISDPLEDRPFGLSCEPVCQSLVIRVIKGRVEHPMGGGRRYAAGPEHEGRLVGRGQDGNTAPITGASLVLGNKRGHVCCFERTHHINQKPRLACSGPAKHCQGRSLPGGVRTAGLTEFHPVGTEGSLNPAHCTALVLTASCSAQLTYSRSDAGRCLARRRSGGQPPCHAAITSDPATFPLPRPGPRKLSSNQRSMLADDNPERAQIRSRASSDRFQTQMLMLSRPPPSVPITSGA